MARRRPSSPSPFSEREFYLQEFRGRTLGLAAPAALLSDPEPLRRVSATLARQGSRVELISTRAEPLGVAAGGHVLGARQPDLPAAVWRSLRRAARLGLVTSGGRSFGAQCREIALRLRLVKLVWLDRAGGLRRPDGQRLSFVDQRELRRLLARPRELGRARLALLREVDAMLSGGVPAVNVCTLAGLAEELFTYSGSGTLFTRDRYVAVRDLRLDDFDAAHDLLRRGVAEGYLAPRSDREVDRILAGGFGAFVEDRHLAGIGALLPHPRARAGEIASLYTLTRFLGEGVGGHLVKHALARARDEQFARVFACTTSDRVGAFFERQGFHPVAPETLPASKWRHYDPRRRRLLHCYETRLPPR